MEFNSDILSIYIVIIYFILKTGCDSSHGSYGRGVAPRHASDRPPSSEVAVGATVLHIQGPKLICDGKNRSRWTWTTIQRWAPPRLEWPPLPTVNSSTASYAGGNLSDIDYEHFRKLTGSVQRIFDVTVACLACCDNWDSMFHGLWRPKPIMSF